MAQPSEDNQLPAIDGSHGEGGGQIIRTSFALSLVAGQSFISNMLAPMEKGCPSPATSHGSENSGSNR
jgi:hypothetical protein